MAKLNREAKLRDKRHEKVMRKNARKRAAAEGGAEGQFSDRLTGPEGSGDVVA